MTRGVTMAETLMIFVIGFIFGYGMSHLVCRQKNHTKPPTGGVSGGGGRRPGSGSSDRKYRDVKKH